MTVFASNKQDPYITLPDDSDNDSEKGDDLIKSNDNLILVGHVVGDQATLEVYGTYHFKFGALIFMLHLFICILNYNTCKPWSSQNSICETIFVLLYV